MKTVTLLTVFWLFAGAAWADERLVLDARINGQPARLALDSVAQDLIVFPAAVERLGLRVIQPSSNNPAPVYTALSQLNVNGDSLWATFKVMGQPAYLDRDIDGLLGWARVKHDVLRIDAAALKVETLTNVSDETDGWMKFRLEPGARMLTLVLPSRGTNIATIIIDTADDRGVSLSPQRWSEWRAANPKQPATLSAVVLPDGEISVKEQCWARELGFGPLTLTNVPVTEFNNAQAMLGSPGNEAVLGIAALKQLDLILDGKQGIAFVQPHAGPRTPYQHNRMGAIFVPGAPQGDDLVCQALDGSPAYEAGIRNGDVLLKIGELDTTKWRSDPSVLPLSRFWNRPAGERLELTVKRGTDTLQKTVVLKDILGSEKSP